MTIKNAVLLLVLAISWAFFGVLAWYFFGPIPTLGRVPETVDIRRPDAYSRQVELDYGKKSVWLIEPSKQIDGFAIYLHTHDGRYASGRRPFCIIGKDGSHTPYPVSNVPQERLLPGRYELDLTRTEMNIRHYLMLYCSAKDTIAFEHVFKAAR